MTDKQISSAAFADTKPHYELLDGLRGVAAMLVIWYHVFEGFASSPMDQKFNHGYMAVDFFFILSGFVIGYAYDDRWKRMSVGEFFKRRVIRLHPMVVAGIVIGAVFFYIQGSVQWDGTRIGTHAVMLAMLLTLFMIPAVPGTTAEIRGNGEMFPVNGPYWSLFFEYIGNIMYALFIRRMSTRMLAVMVAVLGAALAYFAIANCSGYGYLGVGWTLEGNNFVGGMLRMSFSYSAGMLLSRVFRPAKVRGAFWICTVALTVIFVAPHIGDEHSFWMNGLYDATAIIAVFPILVYIAASGKTTDPASARICKFLGDISYPLYVVHYPSMYLFYYKVLHFPNCNVPYSEVWGWSLLLFFGNIALAYLFLKLYDEPVRKLLAKRFLNKKEARK